MREPTLPEARALVWIELYRRERGEGPTWSELGRFLGTTTRRERVQRIHELVPLIEFQRDVPRSTRVRRRALELGLEVIRREARR